MPSYRNGVSVARSSSCESCTWTRTNSSWAPARRAIISPVRAARSSALLHAIHLVTALLWKEMAGESLTRATHDDALAMAAEAHGLPVAGVKPRKQSRSYGNMSGTDTVSAGPPPIGCQ